MKKPQNLMNLHAIMSDEIADFVLGFNTARSLQSKPCKLRQKLTGGPNGGFGDPTDWCGVTPATARDPG